MIQTLRPALYRLFHDLLECSGNIREDKLNLIEKFCVNLDINAEDKEKSMHITFVESMGILSQTNNRNKHKIINCLEQLYSSKIPCTREEALMIVMIKLNLKNDITDEECKIISIDYPNMSFSSNEVLYLEYVDNSQLNSYIQSNLRNIKNGLNMGGYDFIYIPEITKRIKTNKDFILKIIYNINPSLVKEESDYMVDIMSEMKTKQFFFSLAPYMRPSKSIVTFSCLLFKLGTSTVDGVSYTNFAAVRCSKDLTKQIDILVDEINSLCTQQSLLLQKLRLQDEQHTFVYEGFGKIFFDICTYKDIYRQSLLFSPYLKSKLSVQTKDKQNVIEALPSEIAFYFFLLCESNYNNNGYIVGDPKAEFRFEKVYKYFSDKEFAPNIKDITIRNPMLSRIRSTIRSRSDIKQKNLFLPSYDSLLKKIYVPLDISYINIIEENQEKGLLQSKVWSCIYKTMG